MAVQTDLDILQANIGRWADETFPHSTPQTMIRHLREEIGELSLAVEADVDGGGSGDDARAAIKDEAADVLGILLHLCHRYNFSLAVALRDKQAVNESRTWAAPDKRGVSHHVREEQVMANTSDHVETNFERDQRLTRDLQAAARAVVESVPLSERFWGGSSVVVDTRRGRYVVTVEPYNG